MSVKQNYYSENIVWKDYSVVLVLLGTLFLFYGTNNLLNNIILLIFVVCLLFLAINDSINIVFPLLVYFEYILVLPSGGSFIRIFELFFYAWYLLKKRLKFNIDNRVPFICVYILFCCSSITSISKFISTIINIVMMYLISIDLKQDNNKKIYLKSIMIASVFSCFFSFLNVSRAINFGYAIRHSGAVSDPNYSAYYYLIGLIALLGDMKNNRKIKIVIFIFILYSIIRTVSVTGFFVTFLMIFYYLYRYKPNRTIIYISIAIIIIILLINFPFSKENIMYGIQYRINTIIGDLLNRNYESATSNRTEIYMKYLKAFSLNPSILNLLFGGIDSLDISKNSDLFQSIKYVSHNSYIDMLFMTGIIGTFFILILEIISLNKYLKIYKQNKSMVDLSIHVIKASLLLFSLTLSMFPNRYFQLVFLL